jgi:hypothetical protein
MSVWFAVPSCRPRDEAVKRLQMWRDMGYRIALLRQGEPIGRHLTQIEIAMDAYLGWARSTNILCRWILRHDPKAEWIVGGGDDYCPDLCLRAEEIAEDCREYFGRRVWEDIPHPEIEGAMMRGSRPTFGVMQPTGDRWGDTPEARAQYGPNRGAYLDRICGSPWMGREWCQRTYGGRGPMFEDYFHYFADEELQEVAQGAGLLWQRRDVLQIHEHWGRKENATEADAPDWYRRNVTPDWQRSQELFTRRKAAGFPGAL